MEAQALRPSRLGSHGVRLVLPIGLVAAALVWRCPMAELWGVPCPGCGLTRAALALAAGDLAGAIGMHPLSPLLLPFGAALGWRELGLRRPRRASVERPRAGGSPRLVGALAAALLALSLVVWIARFFGAFGGPVPVSSHLHG